MVNGTYYIFTSEVQPFADYFLRQRGKREPVKSLWFSAYWRIDQSNSVKGASKCSSAFPL